MLWVHGFKFQDWEIILTLLIVWIAVISDMNLLVRKAITVSLIKMLD